MVTHSVIDYITQQFKFENATLISK